MSAFQKITGARGMTVDELLTFHRARFGGARMDASETKEKDPAVLNHPQTVARMGEVKSELERLGEIDTLTPEDETYWAELRDTFTQLDKHRKSLERAADLEKIRSAAQGVGPARIIPGSTSSSSGYDRDPFANPREAEDVRGGSNPWDLSEVRVFGRSAEDVAGELRTRAFDAIARMSGASDKVRAAATQILEDFDDKNSTLAKQCLATSSPAYMRAWSKMAKNLAHELTSEESRALAEVRAMSLTDAQGGYLVPFQLDPTIILTANGSYNEIRQAARKVVATGDIWNGVSSGSVAWRWAAEGTQANDGTPTLAQPTVSLWKADGFVPISIEALQDEQNVTSEVARLLAFGKDELEAAAFITGSGTGQPFGIITAVSANAPSLVASATADVYALADVYAVQGALPARYRSRAKWLANNLIYNRTRQFDTSGGGGFWTNLNTDRPPQLLGRDALEAEAMDGVIDAAANNYVLLFGDFENYVIADRIGMTVEFIPHLFGANQRPTGQRGWYAYYRVGADSVNDAAFRLLNV